MSIEQELPGLFEELASDHIVDSPPAMNEPRSTRALNSGAAPRHHSTKLLASVTVAACSVALVVGLVVIGSRDLSPAPTNSAETTPDNSEVAPPDSPTTESQGTSDQPAGNASPDLGLGVELSLDLIRIDTRSSDAGTTGAVLVFDGELPASSPEVVEDVEDPTATGVGYTTQFSDPEWISVCGDTHSFPAPGNRTVDVFVPSAWIDPAASLEPTIEWDPDGLEPAKIIVCEPRAGVVQVSIWGSASARIEDIDISIDARSIIIEITPDPTADTLETSEGEAPTTDPEIRYPTQDEVGRAPASSDDVSATLQDFEVRKLAATGVGADDRDWWTTTWSRTFESGATVFCVGSPTGAGCHDDAYLPSPAPIMALSIGGWPPEFMALIDADVTVTDVKIDNESVRFDQVSLDVPSRRSIVAIPLPNRSVKISVSFVADGREETLDVPFTAEFTQEDLEVLASPDLISVEYGPTPGMEVGDTTPGSR